MAKKLNVAELYAGTGRSIEPFLGWNKTKVSLLVDNNPYAKDVYSLNRPNIPYALANLAKVTSRELLKLAGGSIDILLGCPPCQGFSDVGPREPDDPRNEHLFHFSRFASEIKPKAIAMENVPLAGQSRRFSSFVILMEKLGYRWAAGIANAALWGSCQSRQRLIFVAIRKDIGSTPVFPEPTHGSQKKYFSYRYGKLCKLEEDINGMLGVTPGTRRINSNKRVKTNFEPGILPIPTIGEVLSSMPRLGTPEASNLKHFQWKHRPKTISRMARVPEGGRWKGGLDHFSQAYARLHRRGLARTITGFFPNAGSGRFWHPTENRSLTLREAARIQGFDDSFAFSNDEGKNCTLVGNALDGALSKLTFRMVKSCLS